LFNITLKVLNKKGFFLKNYPSEGNMSTIILLIIFKFKNNILYLAEVIQLKVNNLAPASCFALLPINTLRFNWSLKRTGIKIPSPVLDNYF
jgi:hypothetical protein